LACAGGGGGGFLSPASAADAIKIASKLGKMRKLVVLEKDMLLL